jgi:hypothetical protein
MEMRWAWRVMQIGEMRKSHKIQDTRIVRRRHGWENNIKMSNKKTGCKNMGSIHLAQNRGHEPSVS